MTLAQAQFRALFPALRSWVWLDTPGSPPAAGPVADAMREVVAAWTSGDFDWLAWDGVADDVRARFAGWLGVDPSTVSAIGSVAEAAGIVAGSLPPGRIVVPEQEFRSTLLPWYGRHEVVTVPPRAGATRTEDLVAALDERCTLLAVSEVTSLDGQRLDLAALRAATDAVGARLFVDLTQSLGVLAHDPATIRADYLAVHGYKWMLAPRGAAWLVTRPDRCAELRPLAPHWHSTARPVGYFGQAELADDASRCDASPAWFSWVGRARRSTCTAGSTAPTASGTACASRTGSAPRPRRWDTAGPATRRRTSWSCTRPATVRPDALVRELAAGRVRAAAAGDRVRFGVHYFCADADADADVDTAVASLRRAIPERAAG